MREVLSWWLLALAAIGGAEEEHQPCPRLSVKEVGFNYVQFKGDLHRVRAIQLGRSDVERPMFYKFARELPGEGVLPPFSGIVPLLSSQGFRKGRWYLVCGTSSPPHEQCEECAVVRHCHCDCHEGEDLLLNLTTGKVPVKDNWNSLGVMVGWEAGSWGPLQAYIDASVTWDPYDCDAVPGEKDLCKRPFLNNKEPIRGEKSSATFTVEKARATLVTLDYHILLDLSPVRAAHPNFRLPSSYAFHRGPYELRRSIYRSLSSTSLPIPFPHNERSLPDLQATCRKIADNLDQGGDTGVKAARQVRSGAAKLRGLFILSVLLLSAFL